MLRWIAICLALFVAIAVAGSKVGAQSVATTVSAFNITLAQPTSGPVIPPVAGANTCAVVLHAPSTNSALTPQGSNDGYAWVPLSTIGGGTIRAPGVYVGANPYAYFRVYFSNTAAPGVTGYEACGANALAVLTPLLAGQGGIGPSGPPGSPGPSGPPGAVAAVNVTAPITVSGSSSVLIGCLGTPLACGTVLQGPAYGMVADSGVTDNGVKLQAAYAACNSLGGGIIEVPYYTGTIYGFTTAVRQTGSNCVLFGFGQGAGLGTGHFPTRINGGTIFKAYGSLGGAPLLSLWPTSANEQAGNAVIGIQFDGNSNGTSADLATTGLYITGQFEPYTDRLSFTHFSGPAIHWQGSQIGGSVKGSVVSPHMGDLEMSQPSAWDGPCATIDALAVGSTDWGDVFGGDSGGSFHCNAWNWPGVIIGRSDHLNLPFMQINNPPGAPVSPSPSPGSTTTPTPFPQLAIICGAVENHFSGVVMGQVQQYRAESTTAASPEASCSPPANDPKGTTFSALQTYGNSAMLPGTTVGNITFNDDNGDIILQNSSGSAFTPYICFATGSGANNSSVCPGTSYLMANDSLGNLLIGTRSTATGSIYFCPGGGCSPGGVFAGGAGTLLMDAPGCIVTPAVVSPATPPPNASAICPGYVYINNPGGFSNTFSNGLWSGNSGYLVGIGPNGAMTPVPSPTPWPGGAAYAVTSTPAPSTFHGSAFTCTFVAATTCALGAGYWTSPANFTSSTSIYGCSVASNTNDTVAFTFRQTTNSTGVIDATASNSDVVTGICWGT